MKINWDLIIVFLRLAWPWKTMSIERWAMCRNVTGHFRGRTVLPGNDKENDERSSSERVREWNTIVSLTTEAKKKQLARRSFRDDATALNPSLI